MKTLITVAVIEDNRLVRDGMTNMLNALPDMNVVLAATSFDTSELRTLAPDVVLLDIGLQDANCLTLAQGMQVELPDTRVIVMDLVPVHEELAQFVNAGVAGFILKDATMDDFLHTIRSVASGQRILPPKMTTTLFSQIVSAAMVQSEAIAAEVAEAVRLTTREREVISLIALGKSNKEIAERMSIATHTVKSHVRNVMDKLALRSRLQIAAYAHQQESDA